MKLADQQIIRRLNEIYDAQAAGGAASFASLTGSPSDNAALDSALDAKPTAELDADGTLAANSDAKVATQKAVKTYVDAHSYTAPYLVYAALLTQSGTDAPVATVLGTPTIPGNFAWSYLAPGTFRITADAEPFVDPLKIGVIVSGGHSSFKSTAWSSSAADRITLITYNTAEIAANDTLLNSFIEIRVHP